MLQARMQRGVTGVVTPLNLSEVKFSGSTFGSCTTVTSFQVLYINVAVLSFSTGLIQGLWPTRPYYIFSVKLIRNLVI